MNERLSAAARALLSERRRLVAEMRKIQQDIEQIDRMLAREGLPNSPEILEEEPPPMPHTASLAVTAKPSTVPPSNILTKVQALRRALDAATTPLTPREMVASIQRLGYSFASVNPANTLNPYLYGNKKLDFVKRFGRGFILASREAEFQQRLSSSAAAGQPTNETPPPV